MEQYKKSMRGILPLLAIFLIATCFSCEEDSSTAWDNLCGTYSNYADDAETNLTVTHNGQQAINKEVYIERTEMSSMEEYLNSSLYDITLRNITSIDNLVFRNVDLDSNDNDNYNFACDTIINGREISVNATIFPSYGGEISFGGRSASSMVLDVTETAIQ